MGFPQVAPPSLDISGEQVKSLFDAAKAGTPYKVQLGTKDFASQLRHKAAGAPLTESGLNAQLPAIQVPGDRGQYGKPYEPFRLLANIPTVAMTGPSAAYLQHTTNTNEATRVADGQPKPSLGPTINELFVKPLKIAATVEASMEILQDHEAFAQWLPVELQRSVVNAEGLYLFQANASGGPTASEFNGLLATSGTIHDLRPDLPTARCSPGPPAPHPYARLLRLPSRRNPGAAGPLASAGGGALPDRLVSMRSGDACAATR
jgi:Phage capsid family